MNIISNIMKGIWSEWF